KSLFHVHTSDSNNQTCISSPRSRMVTTLLRQLPPIERPSTGAFQTDQVINAPQNPTIFPETNARTKIPKNEGDGEFRFEVWNRAAFSGFAIRCRRGEKGGGALFRKEIPEKIRKTVSRRTESSCFLELLEDIRGKGIPRREYGGDEGTRLQLGTRRLAWILEQTRKKRRESRMANESFRIPRGILRPCRFAPVSLSLSLSLSPFPPSPIPKSHFSHVEIVLSHLQDL
ncbi:hypothetical protein K0M31_001048, partial [Melipona bicolor]